MQLARKELNNALSYLPNSDTADFFLAARNEQLLTACFRDFLPIFLLNGSNAVNVNFKGTFGCATHRTSQNIFIRETVTAVCQAGEVASDGLGGYSGGTGLEVKRWLLILEGTLPPPLDWEPASPLC